MGYDFKAKNEGVEGFHLGAFSWPVLLDQFGTYFLTLHQGAQWFMVSGVDPRDPEGTTYPGILANSGFEITAEESVVLARMTRNYVTIQKMLGEEHRNLELKKDAPWPLKIRDDFTEKFERFAEWLERCGGFTIH